MPSWLQMPRTRGPASARLGFMLGPVGVHTGNSWFLPALTIACFSRPLAPLIPPGRTRHVRPTCRTAARWPVMSDRVSRNSLPVPLEMWEMSGRERFLDQGQVPGPDGDRRSRPLRIRDAKAERHAGGRGGPGPRRRGAGACAVKQRPGGIGGSPEALGPGVMASFPWDKAPVSALAAGVAALFRKVEPAPCWWRYILRLVACVPGGMQFGTLSRAAPLMVAARRLLRPFAFGSQWEKTIAPGRLVRGEVHRDGIRIQFVGWFGVL